MIREEVLRELSKVSYNISEFFADYGYYVLFVTILGWYIASALKPWLKDQANKRAIRDAMRKERKDILDVELRRIRAQQQADALEAAKKGPPPPSSSMKDVHKRKPLTSSSSSSSSSSSYNPLMGGRGVGGFKPSGFRRQRRGG